MIMKVMPLPKYRQNLALNLGLMTLSAASVVKWSEFLATFPEVPGSIPGATRFSEK
jgi:hypothetical protein